MWSRGWSADRRCASNLRFKPRCRAALRTRVDDQRCLVLSCPQVHVLAVDMISSARERLLQWLRRFRPTQTKTSLQDQGRAVAGSLLAILVTGLVTRFAFGGYTDLPLLIAPMGASAVLLFAVPASPLAQPWAAIGGNTLGGILGVLSAHFISDPMVAAAVAVSLTIGGTSLCRCLHPPAGAVALTAVVGGPVVAAAGLHFVVVPVLVNTLLLVATAIVFNNLVGRRYPHTPEPVPTRLHKTADSAPSDRVGFTRSDVDAALNALRSRLDVDRDDLEALFRELEVRAFQRLHGAIRCDEIMSRDVVSVHEGDTVETACAKLDTHNLRALPVVNSAGQVIAVVEARSLRIASPSALAGEHARRTFAQADQGTPIDALLTVLSRGHSHEVMIVDATQKLVGVVTQTDLLAALYRSTSTIHIGTATGESVGTLDRASR